MSKRTGSVIRKASDKDDGKGNKNQKKSNSSFFQLTNQTIYTIAKVLGVGFLGVFGYILYQKSSSSIQNFMNIETKLLNQTLAFNDFNVYNSKPYLFFCDRERPGKKSSKDNAIENIPPIFSQLNLQKLSISNQNLNFAILNCSQTVTVEAPNKNIYEKFKLKKEVKPLIWGKTPYNNHYYKNVQATGKHLKDLDSMKKFIDFYFQPNAVAVDSHKQFLKYCQFHKHYTNDLNDIQPTCILIFKGDRYQSKLHKELEQRLVSDYPHVRFGFVDGNKFRLSRDDIVTPDTYGIKLYAVRNGTHHLEMINPPTWDYLDTFVSHAASVPLGDYRSGKGEVKLVKPKSTTKTSTRKSKRAEEKKKKVVEEEEIDENEANQEEGPQSTKSSSTSSSKRGGSKASSSKKPSSSQAKQQKTDEEEEVEELESDSFTSSTAQDREDEIDEAEVAANKERERLERERKRREEMERQSRDQLYETAEDSEDQVYQEMDEDPEETVIEL